METAQSIGKLEFDSPINMENSWTQTNLAEKAHSTMELYFYKDNTGFIEWCVDELDIVENIGLVFEIDAQGKRTLTDYDGVFAIPDQALDLLEKHGVDVVEMRKSMNS
mgnify:CR=1 FL=1